MKIYGIYGDLHLWRLPMQLRDLMRSCFSAMNSHPTKKIILVMKLTVLLITIFFLQVSASTKAQITLKENKISLEKALEKISKQSGYDFIYSKQDFKDASKLDVNLNNVTIERALEICFSGQPLVYEIAEKTVMVKRKRSILDKVLDYFSAIDVTGKVVDDKGNPIAGATVRVKGTGIATSTSETGFFSLRNVEERGTIEVSYLGYQTRELMATADLGTIRLEIEVGKLEEITVNAGYYSVSKREMTGSISKVSAKDIENQPVNNALSALQGRMAGVSIVQNSGTPGGGFDVQIRGRNSLRSYNNSGVNASIPLYVIDGIPMPAGNEFRSGMTSAILPYQDTNPLNSINPDDIESIEVLKDADATSIYGSRGANGVILVTTKKGVKGKTQVGFNSSFGIGRVARLPEMMSTEQYVKVRKQALANDGIQNIPATLYDVNGVWDLEKYTNWQKYFIGNTSAQSSNHLTLSGGSERTNFNLTGAHDQQTTVFPGDYRYKRNNVGASIQHHSLDNKFNLSFASYYTTQNNFLPPTDFFRIYTTLSPNAPDLFQKDGTLNWQNSTFVNPLAAATQIYKMDSKQLISNLSLNYQLLEGLNVKINSGYTDNRINEKRLFPKTFYNPSLNFGSERSAIRKGETNSSSWIVEPQVNYGKKIGLHNFQLLFGSAFQEQKTANQVLYASNFPSDQLIENIGSAQSITVNSAGGFTYRYQSLYGRFNYQYDGKYILNLTARRDGSSRFGTGNRYSDFGAIGAAWIVSDEKFLKPLKWLSFAKLRGSYGTTGSDLIGDYQYLDTYQTGLYGYDGVQSINPVRLFNPNFGWEQTKKIEGALEVGVLDNKLRFTGAYYRNRSSSQLVGIPLPGITGFQSLQGNLDATVQNSGWEFTLETVNLNRDEFKWNTSFNFSIPRNKLVKFPNIQGSTYANTLVVGYATNIRKLYNYTGINPATGIYQFQDINNDGRLDVNDRTAIQEMGMRWEAGMLNSVQYKSWKLNFLLQTVSQIQTNSSSLAANLGTVGNLPSQFLDYWTEDNPNAKFQKPTTFANATLLTAASNYTNSDAVVSNATYVRLRNVSLQYDIPKEVLKKVHGSVFFQGQNLWTWTKFKDLDPEFVQTGFTPPLQVFSLGVNLKF